MGLTAPRSDQSLLRLTIQTTDSITGTSTRTPTTVASATLELKPNRLMATATASSKKFDAPISTDGPHAVPRAGDGVEHVGEAKIEVDLDQDREGQEADDERLRYDLLALKPE